MSRRGSRGIPIAPPPVARPSTSLDLVFSVARAASFYGSQLDSPSFVHRYTRPQGSDDDQALDTESLEDRSESHLTTSPDESSDEEADLSLVWDREQAALDQRPKNAVLTSLHERFSSELLEPNARVDENTSLLRAASSPDSFSRRTAFVQNARKRRSGTSTAASFISRRLSVISSDQVFEAAINRRRGESTKNQTLFNCVNVLIGVALLGEPLAFSHSGWLLGFGLLVFCALVTNYTAKMLHKMMMRDHTLTTYAEVLISAYGVRAKTSIYLLFALELGSLSIALVVLFGDSMHELFPSVSSQMFKIVGYFVIVPTTYVPIRLLSITSLLGILSCFFLIVVIVLDGVISPSAPGSLLQVMPTSFSPSWHVVPLSFGTIMSGFSGHAVVPSLVHDMAHPETEFNSTIDTAYIIAFVATLVTASAGYLMYGDSVSSEITRDLIKTGPAWLNRAALYAIALSPIVKYALASAPLTVTIEHLIGVRGPTVVLNDGSSVPVHPPTPPPPTLMAHLRRPLITALVVVLAIVIPDFELVLSFLGSCSSFLICAIGPIGAFLILGGDEVGKNGIIKPGLGTAEKCLCWFLLAISCAMAITGTIWIFLPSIYM